MGSTGEAEVPDRLHEALQIDVYRNTFGSGLVTFDLETSTADLETSAVEAGMAGSFWMTVAPSASIAASALGVVRMSPLSYLGDWLRWRVTTPGSGAVDFDIVLWLRES